MMQKLICSRNINYVSLYEWNIFITKLLLAVLNKHINLGQPFLKGFKPKNTAYVDLNIGIIEM